MYITKVKIKNIRTIEHFIMEFPENAAGWHVLIGDNGSGKTSLVRSISLGLIGIEQSGFFRQNWDNWLSKKKDSGTISVWISVDEKYDSFSKENSYRAGEGSFHSHIIFERTKDKVLADRPVGYGTYYGKNPWNLEGAQGWFSAAFGPFRRFTGGSDEWQSVWSSFPKISAHLSAFSENVALTECIKWLVELNHKRLEKRPEGKILNDIIRFINQGNLLPQNAKLYEVTSEGVFFKDGNSTKVNIIELSDGFRSILSMTLELVRQMVQVFNPEVVFQQVKNGGEAIDVPGVVLIDEIDAHLHPTWQARIGEWFLKYFPKIQFIVTTHSPIICRAAEHGSIWRLTAPGSDEPSREITGKERDRLIYGNVLEALGTEAFGSEVVRSDESKKMLKRMSELNIKSIRGQLDEKEEKELQELKSILPTGK
ncbi:MAG: AAA family ATPase [Phaeodactylibacter sp.]|nr:AAA family ATPase [Phaeodactylibacter sp.]